MDDNTRSVTVDKRNRVSLGDLVEPGQQYAAWRSGEQIIMAPVVTIVRTPENTEVLDRIDAFLKDPSTGVRRERPRRRVEPDPQVTQVRQAMAKAGFPMIDEDDEQAARDQYMDQQWERMGMEEGSRG